MRNRVPLTPTAALLSELRSPATPLGRRLGILDHLRDRRRRPPTGWEGGPDNRVLDEQMAEVEALEADLARELADAGPVRAGGVQYHAEAGRIRRGLPWGGAS
jgi:hypothetical protein